MNTINQEVQQILYREFNWIYRRICNKIHQITGKNTVLHPKLPYPGFHISELKHPYEVPYFHTDTSITEYISNIDMSGAYSLLVLIEKPSEGAWLESKVGDVKTKHHYQYGALHRWKSTVPHRVGQFNTGEGERRITLQCHYYYNSKLDCNLVYL